MIVSIVTFALSITYLHILKSSWCPGEKGQIFRKKNVTLGQSNILSFLNVPPSSPGGYFTFLVDLGPWCAASRPAAPCLPKLAQRHIGWKSPILVWQFKIYGINILQLVCNDKGFIQKCCAKLTEFRKTSAISSISSKNIIGGSVCTVYVIGMIKSKLTSSM